MERQSDLEELLAVNDVSTEVRGVTRGRVLGAVAAVAVIGVVAAVALGGVPETRLRAGRHLGYGFEELFVVDSGFFPNNHPFGCKKKTQNVVNNGR